MAERVDTHLHEPEYKLDHYYQSKVWTFEELPLHVRVALLFGWSKPEIEYRQNIGMPAEDGALPTLKPQGTWVGEAPDALADHKDYCYDSGCDHSDLTREIPRFDEYASVGGMLLLLKPDLLHRHHRYDNSSYWAAYANGVRTAAKKDGQHRGNVGQKIWAVGNSPGQALCMLVLELNKYETGRKFLLGLRK